MKLPWQKPEKVLPDKLNICLVVNKFPILGRAADHGFLWPIARRLASKGHGVTILAWKNPQGKSEILQDNVHAYFLGANRSNSDMKQFPEFARKKFEQLHGKRAFHLVHSIDANGVLIGLRKKQYQVAMTYDVEATQMSKIFAVLGMAQETPSSIIRTGLQVLYRFLVTFYGRDRKILKTADGVFVTSPQQRIILERHYLYPEYRTYLVPYGIEIGDLSPRERSEEFRAKWGIPENARTVVTISDMTEVAEIRNLLRAFEKVAIKKPASRLIVVGHGPLFKTIEHEMLTLALGNKVIFVGAVTNAELPEYIGLADVYVNLSSRTTGFEPSTLEAMAQQKVIIGSEVSPISTIVDDGVNGFLIRPADVQSLATLLIQIFTDQIPAEQIGEQARKKVVKIFDTEKMANKTMTAYYKTLKNTGYYG